MNSHRLSGNKYRVLGVKRTKAGPQADQLWRAMSLLGRLLSTGNSYRIAFVGATVRMLRGTPFVRFALTFAVISSTCFAEVVPVRHKEGTAHGFLVLHSLDGKLLATGETIQTTEGERVTSETVFHFRDGSLHDELTVFSQNSDFHLISDHLRQQGPSFPKPIDVIIDAASGNVEIISGKDPKQNPEQEHLQIPEDAANGLIFVLLKNLPSEAPETTFTMVTPSSKPRVVKLKVHSAGEQAFSAGGARIEATHYVVHTDIGGVTGAVASAVGKQPPDLHFWVVGGKAPAFVKFTGQLFVGGPMWNIELAPIRWANSSTAKRRQ